MCLGTETGNTRDFQLFLRFSADGRQFSVTLGLSTGPETVETFCDWARQAPLLLTKFILTQCDNKDKSDETKRDGTPAI